MEYQSSLQWTKASACTTSHCIEVASHGEGMAMRDSKQDNGPILTFTAEAWRTFLLAAKNGDFDLLMH
jgi:hypothetical protein